MFMRRQRPKRCNAADVRMRAHEAGMSLVSMLVAIAILSVAMLLISQLLSSSILGTQSVANRQDLEGVKQLIRTRLDCKASLGVTAATTLPLTCASYASVVPKSADGAQIASGGKIGSWTIAAGCNLGRLLITATRNGTDPLTHKAYSGAPEASDLFRGMSDFCSEYFDSSTVCSGTYPSYQGLVGKSAKCCREIETDQSVTLPPQGAAVACGAGEYVSTVSGSCMANPVPTRGMLHYVNSDYSTNAYVDCYGFDWTTDSEANAFALCCPRN